MDAATKLPVWDASIRDATTKLPVWDASIRVESICCSIKLSHGARYVLFTLRTYLYENKYAHSINIASIGGDAESSHDTHGEHDMYATPPPPVTQDSQTHEEELLRSRGLRDHHGSNR